MQPSIFHVGPIVNTAHIFAHINACSIRINIIWNSLTQHPGMCSARDYWQMFIIDDILCSPEKITIVTVHMSNIQHGIVQAGQSPNIVRSVTYISSLLYLLFWPPGKHCMHNMHSHSFPRRARCAQRGQQLERRYIERDNNNDNT